MKGVLIGQEVSKMWRGERYVFKRVSRGEWKCIWQDSKIIPHQILSELGE